MTNPFEEWANDFDEWNDLGKPDRELPEDVEGQDEGAIAVMPDGRDGTNRVIGYNEGATNVDGLNIDDVHDAIGGFLDSLPDPNATNLWESKLDDLALWGTGFLIHEVYDNFVEGHFPEWLPNADDFATMEAYRAAKKQEVAKIKYVLGFAMRAAVLTDRHLRGRFGNG